MSSQTRKRRKHEEIEDKEEVVHKMDANEEQLSDEESDDLEEEEDFDDTEDDNEDKELIDKELEIDFGAYQPNSDDFNGIKCLLAQLWLKEKINVSELTQLLIDQNFICSVIKQEGDDEDSDGDSDDEDVYGVTSVISFADYSGKDCIKDIKKTLISYIPKDNKINELLNSSPQKMGLIVNERFANLPPKISLPSYQQLLNDLKTTKDSKNQLTLDFDWLLMVCKVLKPKATNSKKSIDSDVIYVNAEDEIFDELADHRFEYSVANQCDSDVFDWKDDEQLFEPFRKILIISYDNWIKTINKLKDEFK